MRRILTAVLAAACLVLPCRAAGLDERMETFRQKYGLNEQNFSIAYRNTVTGESYVWNEKRFMAAASTYKLPLNLYYYEQESAGAVSPTASVGGTSLADAHYRSLVLSDNDVSIAMLYRLGSFRTYKQLMRKYFTLGDAEIASVYYSDNYYCASMMLDCLQYLYDRRDAFPEMMRYLGEAQPNSYFRRDVSEYPIAHKYGCFEGAVNDAGIVFTPQPFLLAVYTQDVGEDVVADACRVLTDYTLAQYRLSQPTETAAPDTARAAAAESAAPETAAVPESVRETAAAQAEESASLPWGAILAAAFVLLAADAAVLIRMCRNRAGTGGRR